MGFVHGHAARVTAVSPEESRRVSNAKTHNFPLLVLDVFEKDFQDLQRVDVPRGHEQGTTIPCWIKLFICNVLLDGQRSLRRRCRRFSP